MALKFWIFTWYLCTLTRVPGNPIEDTSELSSIYYTEPGYASSNSIETGYKGLTEFSGGKIIKGRRTFERSKSPYILREDLFIERGAELFIEPGVEIRFAPMIGITVRGVINALVSYILKFIIIRF